MPEGIVVAVRVWIGGVLRNGAGPRMYYLFRQGPRFAVFSTLQSGFPLLLRPAILRCREKAYDHDLDCMTALLSVRLVSITQRQHLPCFSKECLPLNRPACTWSLERGKRKSDRITSRRPLPIAGQRFPGHGKGTGAHGTTTNNTTIITVFKDPELPCRYA